MNPDVKYIKYYHEVPTKYCCTTMQREGEDTVNVLMSTLSPRMMGILPLLRKGNTNVSILV